MIYFSPVLSGVLFLFLTSRLPFLYPSSHFFFLSGISYFPSGIVLPSSSFKHLFKGFHRTTFLLSLPFSFFSRCPPPSQSFHSLVSFSYLVRSFLFHENSSFPHVRLFSRPVYLLFAFFSPLFGRRRRSPRRFVGPSLSPPLFSFFN